MRSQWVLAVMALAACGTSPSPSRSTVASPTETGDSGLRTARATAATYDTSYGEVGKPLPSLSSLASISVGPLAGDVINPARKDIKNPYTGDQAAINQGGELFIHMNCASCHGFEGGGGMGPALADQYWRFGGDDADIFNSIYNGRGRGMPSWKDALNEDEIWKLVAFIRTLPDSAAAANKGSHAAPGTAQQPTANAQGSWREPLKGSQEEP